MTQGSRIGLYDTGRICAIDLKNRYSKGISKRLAKLSENHRLLKRVFLEKKLRCAVFIIQKIQTFAKTVSGLVFQKSCGTGCQNTEKFH